MSLRTKLNNRSLLWSCWKSIYWSKSVSKKSRSKGIDGQTIEAFYINESTEISKIYQLLLNNSYKLNKLFAFSVKKENKSEYRLITAATIKDRIIHKAILTILNPEFLKYINTGVSYCGVKENFFSKKKNVNSLNTKYAILKLIEHVKKKNYWIVKTDIKGFYDNVPKRKLFNIYKKLCIQLLLDDSLHLMIRDIIFFKIGNKEEIVKENKASLPTNKYKGISQGSSLSQFFANLYLADLDRYMKKKYGDRFIRYIDDILIICKTEQEAINAKEELIKYLTKKSLSVSKEKTYVVNLQKENFNFLGLNFSKESIKWKKTKKEAQKWISDVLDHNNQEYYKDCKQIPLKVKKMNDKIGGLEDYLRYYHTKETFDLMNKYIKLKIRKDRRFKMIRLLDISKIKPIIQIQDWQMLFKN